jgi:hypothetical protein
MTLRKSTLDNAANRRRFVNETAAFPYIRHRERQNARRGFREALRALDEARRASTYGSDQAQTVAMDLLLIAQRAVHYAAQLRDLPTIAEIKAVAARQAALSRWRAARTLETTASKTVTDHLAAD